jgi:hypothetical protein
MPFTLRLDPLTGILIGTCSGALELADAKAGAVAVWERPDWRGRAVVWDMREAEIHARPTEVRRLAEFVLGGQPAAPPPRVAFVTDRDADFGMLRMFEVYRAHPATEVRIFRDFDEAVAWTARTAPGA